VAIAVLSGCAGITSGNTKYSEHTNFQTRVYVPSIPYHNLECPTVPIPPNPDTATQRDIAIYLPEVIEIAEHCRLDLAVVRDILNQAQE